MKNNHLILLENFHFWESRKYYLELMERFINGKIDGKQFESEFYQRWKVDRDKKDIYNLKEFPDNILNNILKEFPEFPDKIHDVELSKLDGFSALMSELFTDCDVFEPDPAFRKSYEISEEELRNCVKKCFLQIQKYL